MEDQFKKKKNIRKDYSGDHIGSWIIKKYAYHYKTSPIWVAQCEYCNRLIESSLPKIKKNNTCECEENMKWWGNIHISNSIYIRYSKNASREGVEFDLNLIDLYKMYNRQNGVDTEGNPLIFDFHWDYSRHPATCNYIWPDLVRDDEMSSYNLKNCTLVANTKQRHRKPLKFKK